VKIVVFEDRFLPFTNFFDRSQDSMPFFWLIMFIFISAESLAIKICI
jgi:hypothetical protein